VTSYTSFFTGTATVAGALVGLLFVALSVSPERLRGDTGSLEHQAIAATAFTALVNALFVSLIGLEPGGGLRYGALILGLIGLSSSCGLALRLWRGRRVQELSGRWPLLLGVIIAIYAVQVVTGAVPMSATGRADQAATFVYAMFAIGIVRAWELLGLHGGGLLSVLTQGLARRPTVAQPGPSREPGAPAMGEPGPGQPGRPGQPG
jgi:Kef-type K+ transport system membrane component KefB